MDIKPELQKTIKRLVSQKNYDVLKAKLRNWIAAKEVSIVELLRQCREKTIFIPAIVLNKIGMLFSTGKEGITEDPDIAFMFYLLAADLDHPSANGNVATYYFNGRAPGGKNLALAYQYCRRAIELGCDKFILMSEILHEKQDYTETIRYIRSIMDKPSYAKTLDLKKKIDIRKLEINCLHQELISQYLSLFSRQNMVLLIENILLQQERELKYFSYSREKAALQSPEKKNHQNFLINDLIIKAISGDEDEPLVEGFHNSLLISSPVITPAVPPALQMAFSPEKERLKSPANRRKYEAINTIASSSFDSSINEGKRSVTISIPSVNSPKSPRAPSSSSAKIPTILSSLGTPKSSASNLLAMKANSSFSMSFTIPATGAMPSTASVPSVSNGQKDSTTTVNATSSGSSYSLPQPYLVPSVNSKKANAGRAYSLASKAMQYPGWYAISEEIEGFDASACLELTAKSEKIALECEVMKTATEYAQTYLQVQFPLKHSSSSSGSSSVVSPEIAQSLQFLQQYSFNQSHQNNLYQNQFYLQQVLVGQLQEFQGKAQVLQQQRQVMSQLWQQYADLSEHLLRRQVLAEKKFFNPLRNQNLLCFLLAKEWLHHRLYDYEDYLSSQNVFHQIFVPPSEFCNEALHLFPFTAKYGGTPYARLLLVAERSLLELSIAAYGRSSIHRPHSVKSSQPQYHHRAFPAQRTGWTGSLNQYVSDLDDVLNNIQKESSGSKAATMMNSLKESLWNEKTYPETIVLGDSVIRLSHKTYPQLSEPVHPSTPFQHNQHLPSLRGNHQSFCEIEEVTTSRDILVFLNRVTMVSSPAAILALGNQDQYDRHYLENERRLVDFIFQFTSKGLLVTLQDLQSINEDCAERDLHFFYKMCYFYFVQRLVPWILSLSQQDDVQEGEKEEEDVGLFHTREMRELPLATAQVRGLLLVKYGFLSFQELFELSSPYGIFYFDNTIPPLSSSSEMVNSPQREGEEKKKHKKLSVRSTSTVKEAVEEVEVEATTTATSTTTAASSSTPFQTFELLRQQIVNINDLYQKALLESSASHYHAFIQFWKNHPQGKTLSTYQLCKQELVFGYGGEGDSDNEEEEEGSVSRGRPPSSTMISLTASAAAKLKRAENAKEYGVEDNILGVLFNRLKI